MNLASDPIAGGLGFQEFDAPQPDSVSELVEKDLASRKEPNYNPDLNADIEDTSESITWAEE